MCEARACGSHHTALERMSKVQMIEHVKPTHAVFLYSAFSTVPFCGLCSSASAFGDFSGKVDLNPVLLKFPRVENRE